MQVAALLLSLASGHILASVLNIAGLALVAERHLKRKQLLDPLELWKQLPHARRRAYMKLIAYGVTFAFTMFRCALTALC
jgi:Cornichon protein